MAKPKTKPVLLMKPVPSKKEEYKAVLSPFFRSFYKIVDNFKCK